MTKNNSTTKIHSYELVCSLGERCMTAHQLHLNKLRSESNPFDWLVTGNLNSVINTLLDNCNHFFLKENLVIVNNNLEHLTVTDSTTGFISLHDFYTNESFDAEYTKFVDKYTRKINRLMNLIHSKKSILFVRTNVPSDEIKYLLRLTELNPEAKIDFLIINTTDTNVVKQLPSPYDNVYIYEISKTPDFSYDIWQGNHAHWKEVLSQFSLIGYQDWLVQTLKKYLGNKTLVIWGFGGAGKKIIEHLKSAENSIKIGWIVDRNTDKIGKISDTLEVKDVSSLESHSLDVIVLICIYGNTTKIEQDLKEMNFSQDSIKKIIYDGLAPVKIE